MTRRTGKSRVTPKKVYNTDPTKKPDGPWVFCHEHGRWEHLGHDTQQFVTKQSVPQINEERSREITETEIEELDEVIELGDELVIAENPIEPQQLAEPNQDE